ncbi:isoprenylcysteine carboxylmethyltransferase family protein [Microbacterium sp. Marseille-Q6965]|uniref:methyltransferase family protein n=1 Tax=Microbacterium sp. Marseille-Q6965 TaxID=2965072 RepID=UPI0021B6FF43|nr:isoprenylcysteine carboxylmethyltransferase family protein [Microbacterium sp. Marseille-Q6965]
MATLPWLREATLGHLDPVLLAILDVPLFVLASAAAAGGSRVAVVIATGWTCLVAAGMVVYATATGLAGWGALAMIAAACGSGAAAGLATLGRVPVDRLLRGPLAFRAARPRAGALRHLALTAAQTVCFWGLFLAVIPPAVALIERRWGLDAAFAPVATPMGLALLLLASGLGLWAAWSIATRGDGTPLPSAMPNRLVVAGPYRLVRNPMAVAGILQGVAVGLLLSSWLTVTYALCGAVLWHVFVRPLEESDLEARFGDEYRHYRSAVRCWWPVWRRRPARLTSARADRGADETSVSAL